MGWGFLLLFSFTLLAASFPSLSLVHRAYTTQWTGNESMTTRQAERCNNASDGVVDAGLWDVEGGGSEMRGEVYEGREGELEWRGEE